ncbi:MAG: tetratricopeptide repeat protein, partial [Planctomycetes bacterium]|nr:tetratricopeptide repeat protein [Planctomycetota bacterium]
LVPALLLVLNDFRRTWHWLRKGVWPAPEEVEPALARSRRQEDEELARGEEVPLPEEIAETGLPPAPSGRVTAGKRARRVRPPSQTRVLAAFRRIPEVEALIEKGNQRAAKGDPSGALTCFLAALLHEPRRAYLHFQVGLLRGQLGDWHGAAASFDRAIEIDPGDTDAREYRAWALLRAHEYQAAANEFSHRLETDPANVLARKGRATALLAMGRTDEAAADLSAALVRSPKNADLYYLRANALRAGKEHEKAVADYDTTLAARPDHAGALLGRGRSFHALGRYEEAIPDFDRALATTPPPAEALLHRGRARIALRRHREALDDLTAFLAESPDRLEVHLLLGACRDALGDPEGAAADYRTYLERFPRSKKRRILQRYIRYHLPESVAE